MNICQEDPEENEENVSEKDDGENNDDRGDEMLREGNNRNCLIEKVIKINESQ